ncbi:MAG: hypothetical protein H0X37_00945 [Herpetosiphonaceae bacterium]|nr:hypothetical protein [Herpetosiphonaceae bacterium]
MSYRYEYEERRRGSSAGRCLLVALAALILVVLGSLLLIRYVGRPLLTRVIQRRIAQQVPGGTVPDQTNPQPVPQENLAPADVPAGRIVISEADANQWLQDHKDQFQGIDSVVVHFVPGVITADVAVRGFTSTAQAGVAVQNGRIVATNPQLGPPANFFVDIQPFVHVMEDSLNSDLASLNRRVTGVELGQGIVTITLQ